MKPMNKPTRREFLKKAAAGAGALAAGAAAARLAAQEAGERPSQWNKVRILNPRNRAPVSLIIDDSTCLVNLAHFGIPQFAEVFPDQYRQDWRRLPREIPDAFVRRFGEWCAEHGVKGKYSLVPYPACVGWLDRDLPGWSHRELIESLRLIRELLSPNWDFHPEMVSHTWVINPDTGRPYPERSPRFMENWGWTDGKSADELANYMAFALGILKNVGIRCEGITTPGGFGSRALPQLAQAALEACRAVFGAEIPHYFRHLFTDERSVAPRVEYASGLASDDPRCVVSIIGCTGDWFGGWDGLRAGDPDRCITRDGRSGRLPEVIRRGEPAIMVCHWPGLYFNGLEKGFHIFKEVVRRLEAAYDNLLWMKLSEIARYWAARELTAVEPAPGGVRLRAPFAAPDFTLRIPGPADRPPRLAIGGREQTLREASGPRALRSGYWVRSGAERLVCFDLPKGACELRW